MASAETQALEQAKQIITVTIEVLPVSEEMV